MSGTSCRRDTPDSPFDDDVAMALLPGRGAARAGDVDLERLARRWIEWMDADGRGAGNWTRTALNHIRTHGSPPSGTGGRAPNGAVMRAASRRPRHPGLAPEPRERAAGTPPPSPIPTSAAPGAPWPSTWPAADCCAGRRDFLAGRPRRAADQRGPGGAARPRCGGCRWSGGRSCPILGERAWDVVQLRRDRALVRLARAQPRAGPRLAGQRRGRHRHQRRGGRRAPRRPRRRGGDSARAGSRRCRRADRLRSLADAAGRPCRAEPAPSRRRPRTRIYLSQLTARPPDPPAEGVHR